jgi:integrase
MGRRSKTGGIISKGDRVQFDFTIGRTRYRPTIDNIPTEANLRRARKRLEDIKRRIRSGTFDFAEEFPDYRFISKVSSEIPIFDTLADQWLASIKSEVEFSTYESYRKILAYFWRPRIGKKYVNSVKYSDLTTELANYPWQSRKTRNNVVSVARLVFDFGVTDNVISRSPAQNLKSLKIQKTPPDPYPVEEAEAIISGILKDWGQYDSNYVEFGFFTGTRPSESIALQWPDIDLKRGIARIDKARVMARDKDRTKTSVAREIELCPRALAILKKQWTLTGLQGKHVFGQDNGRPYHDLQMPWSRWQYTHKRLKMRYREPYQMRHTSVTWNLMIGKNLLWVAEQHGHSPAVMLKTYAKWLKGATENDVDLIRRVMGFGTNSALAFFKKTDSH